MTWSEVCISTSPPYPQSVNLVFLGSRPKHQSPRYERGFGLKESDVVYIDLTGPQSVQSASSFNYVMNIIDDASPYIYTCLLLLKSSTIKALKDWVLLAEQEMGKTIGSFNINNGELKSIEFIEFCASQGIKPHWTAPSMSAQDG